MPTYLLQWEAMRWARAGCGEYDLWGVPDDEEPAWKRVSPSARMGCGACIALSAVLAASSALGWRVGPGVFAGFIPPVPLVGEPAGYPTGGLKRDFETTAWIRTAIIFARSVLPRSKSGRLRAGSARSAPPAAGSIISRPKASAGAVVEAEGRLLLSKRDIEPWMGCWCLPAGYMEVDETPAQAAVREVFEETGLIVRVSDLLNVYFFDDDPRGNGILILYSAAVTGGSLHGSAEGREVRFFAPEEIPENLAGAEQDRAIRAWLAGRRADG